MNISAESSLVLTRLRPPFARSAYVLFTYTNQGLINDGITFETLVGEPAVAPGAGKVTRIYTAVPDWQTNDAELKRSTVQHIVIDHGNSVTTVIGGFSSLSVAPGKVVNRGDKLGDLFTNQLFFSLAIGKKSINPCAIGSHWLIQNGNVVTGQAGKIRFAPDRLVRDLSNGINVILAAGLHYFTDLFRTPQLLLNVAFNGNGSKIGAGAVSVTADDYWNVYTPEDFLATVSGACYYYYYGYYGVQTFYAFSADVVLELNDYTGEHNPVFLERIAPLFSAAGSAASWDNMLTRWVGGYLGPVPYENTFRLRGMATGNYELYLYANQGATTFYAAVSYDMPVAKPNSPTATPAFLENLNYVKYTLTVPPGGFITFKAVGYLSGMQLKRV